jgi:hypothetical protein
MEYYKKVYIKGKAENLPKEEGVYIAKRKDGGIYVDEYFAGNNSLTRWPQYIDWYLLPVSEAEQREELI